MRVALLSTPTSAHTARWTGTALTSRGHAVDPATTVDAPGSAATVGHSLTTRWRSTAPDVVLALGWEAGLAAHVAARDTAVPVVLRLTQAARRPGSDRDRLESALARGSSLVLVPSVGEAERLVERGVRRTSLRILPDAVDRARFVDRGAEVDAGGARRVALAAAGESSAAGRLAALVRSLPACRAVVVSDAAAGSDDLPQLLHSVDVLAVADDSPDEVALVLQAMSCGVPTVAVDTGVLSDLVAHDVTGLLVRHPGAVSEALRSLLCDPMRRQGMGLAAVDRVRARFDCAVVGAALERLLLEVVPERSTAAVAS